VALSRRDFTINSIALDVLSGEVHDPFNGREDLSNRVLRITNVDSFGDDPLRVLRAAQFIARFQLVPDTRLSLKCGWIVDQLRFISAERKFEEFNKLLLKGVSPGAGLNFLADANLLDGVFPELWNLVTCSQSPIHHAEGNVFNHTCFALDKAAEFGISDVAKWAVLCHDFGKPATTVVESGKTVAHDHENHIAPVVSFLSNLRAPKKLVDQVVVLVQEHLSPVRLENPSKLRKLARKLASVDLTVDDLIGVAKADQFGRIGTKSAEEINDRLDKFRRDFDKAIEVIDVRKPIISGKDLVALGVRPGPRIGQLLKIALDLEDDGKDREEILSIIKNTQ
jgi:tRNA nucleotidyltransferase (CCA-adding enzyme)